MRFWRRCAVAWLLAVAGTCCVYAGAQGHKALQVKLETPLDTRPTQTGARVAASAVAPWADGGCSLKAGNSVTGHVLAVQSMKASGREANLAVAFDAADCNGQHGVPLSLLAVALVHVEPTEPERQAEFYPGLFGRGGRVYTGIGLITEGRKAVPSGPKSVESGQVVGLKKVTLDIGGGPQGSSVLRSTSREISLDTQAEFVLTVRSAETETRSDDAASAGKESTGSVASATLTALPVSVPEEPDTTAVCDGDCTAADAVGAPPMAAGASHVTALLPFGYSLRTHLRTEFDQDTTVTYLSARQVLVTFDAHRLRIRVPGVWPDVERRSIRAVLLDGATGAVQRVLDWTVEGEGQYLWPAGPGRVVVHLPGVLQVFGVDLNPGPRVSADGEVRWVASSPSGDELAFGVIRERHTREIHNFIRDRTGRDPEEDLEVRLVDQSGALRFTRQATSEMQAPVLLDGNKELVLRYERGRRWTIRESSNGRDARTIVTVSSSCEPSVSTLHQDDLFVVGCDGRDHWYRVIRNSGRTMLLGRSSPFQIEERAVGSGTSSYAIRVVRSKVPLTGIAYAARDLAEEQVSVYGTANHRQLLVVKIDSFPEASRNFALSSAGDQLVVLTRSDVQFYTVEGSSPAPAGVGQHGASSATSDAAFRQ